MFDKYFSDGCIKFKHDSYAVSIPIFKRKNSNYLYIPKTDARFLVLDFYQITDLNYEVQYYNNYPEPISIGDLLIVPVLQGDDVFHISPNWSADEIKLRCPTITEQALKGFVSLRKRLAEKPVESGDFGLNDGFFKEPVRSRYWISKLSASVRSALSSQNTSKEALNTLRSSRNAWLEKFISKSSLKLVLALLDIPGLANDDDDRTNILLDRARYIFTAKGLYVAHDEVSYYLAQFPNGIIHEKRYRAKNAQELRDYTFNIVSRVDQDFGNLFTLGGKEREFSINAWSMDELERVHRCLLALAGEENYLQVESRFHRILSDGTHGLKRLTDQRYEFVHAFLDRNVNSKILDTLFGVLGARFDVSKNVDVGWLSILRGIVQYHDKVILVDSIANANTRFGRRDDFGFPGVDYVLLNAITEAIERNRIDVLRGVVIFEDR